MTKTNGEVVELPCAKPPNIVWRIMRKVRYLLFLALLVVGARAAQALEGNGFEILGLLVLLTCSGAGLAITNWLRDTVRDHSHAINQVSLPGASDCISCSEIAGFIEANETGFRAAVLSLLKAGKGAFEVWRGPEMMTFLLDNKSGRWEIHHKNIESKTLKFATKPGNANAGETILRRKGWRAMLSQLPGECVEISAALSTGLAFVNGEDPTDIDWVHVEFED